MTKMLVLCMALSGLGWAQTPTNMISRGCATTASADSITSPGRLLVNMPTSFLGSIIWTPTCLTIGPNLVISKTPPFTIDAGTPVTIVPLLSRMVVLKIQLDIFAPQTQTVQTVILANTPTPDLAIFAILRSSTIGGDTVDVVMPQGANTKQVNIQLPTYRPLQIGDVVTIVYWTRDPLPAP